MWFDRDMTDDTHNLNTIQVYTHVHVDICDIIILGVFGIYL